MIKKTNKNKKEIFIIEKNNIISHFMKEGSLGEICIIVV